MTAAHDIPPQPGSTDEGIGAAPQGAHPDSAAAPGATDTAQDPAQALAELQAKYAEMSEAYLRAKAETENIRRRSEEESSKARKFAVESFASSLLPVKDSLEAALATEAGTAEQVLQGVHATLRQLQAALESSKVAEINPGAGEKFDPHSHQAISMAPADQEANTVVTVLQKGYRLFDRILRPALVTVTAPK